MLQSEFIFKVLLLGDGAVGKTALRERYLGQGFKATYLMTIGADFALKKIQLGQKNVKMQIWDLAGQERFESVRPGFYGGSHAGVVVFDCTRRETLDNVSKWIEEAFKYTGHPIPLAFVSNKTDLRSPSDPKHISIEDGKRTIEKFHQKYKISDAPLFIEASAKTGENVTSIFEDLAEVVISRILTK